jgi:hypothetical protein
MATNARASREASPPHRLHPGYCFAIASASSITTLRTMKRCGSRRCDRHDGTRHRDTN